MYIFIVFLGQIQQLFEFLYSSYICSISQLKFVKGLNENYRFCENCSKITRITKNCNFHKICSSAKNRKTGVESWTSVATAEIGFLTCESPCDFIVESKPAASRAGLFKAGLS